ncbi:MAG: hypothetical protein NTX76_06395 [Alphaproteobacteria bacterium]|nr:hypothetical protein [Alphaproteobacteria bacterium]
MKKHSRLLSLSFVLLLSSCQSRIEKDSKLAYETKQQIPINTALIQMQYDFDPMIKSSGTDSLFSRDLTQAIEKWAYNRLRTVGQSGTAQLTVRDASILKLPNPMNPAKFEGRLDVVLSLVNAKGIITAQTEAKIKREKQAPNNMTDEERKDLTDSVIKDVINAFDLQMEGAIMSMMASPVR